MFESAVNTLQWLTQDQRLLMARRFDDGRPFTLDLLLPLYASKEVRQKGGTFRRRKVAFVWEPEHIAQVHKTPSEIINVSSAYAFLKPYFGDESVFCTEGQGHAPAKQAVMRTIRDHMTMAGDDYLFFQFSVREQFRPGTYAVLDPLQRVTAAFLIRTIFGEQGTKAVKVTIGHAMGAASNANATILMLPTVLRFTRAIGTGLAIRRQKLGLRKFIHDQLDGMAIAEHWHHQSPADARSEICDNLMTFLIAGFETTATTIAWLLYELATHQEIQTELRAEAVRRLAEDPIAYFEDDDTLLAHCVQEALRLHPSIPFMIRECSAAFSVGGLDLKAGDYIVMSIEELHRRAFEDGRAFKPQRYAQGAAQPKLGTFGGGAKICPGRAIAVQQARIITALLVTTYLVETTKRTTAKVIRNRVSATPKGGMVLSFHRIM